MTVKTRIDPSVHMINPGRPPWVMTALTLLVLGGAVLAVYYPLRTAPDDNMLFGADYGQLHMRRLAFVEDALFGSHPHLPGWYPRELLGTPFWSNIQNFPFLPTRLILLLFDPLSAFTVGVIMAAELAALFTFIYARAVGFSQIGAAAAGWTFACSGYFAARVMCGHLPLLEVYGALPLLLWLVHRCLKAAPGRRRTMALRTLGVTTTLICFAGHPQLPAYAISAAGLYAIWMNASRSRTSPPISTLQILATMAFGVGIAALVLYPMLLLIGRSSRVLALDPPNNDQAFPFSRLLAFVLPWKDGWPPSVMRFPLQREHFSNVSIFWETVCYEGLLPLAAALYFLVAAIWRRRLPARMWIFITVIGIGGLMLALPPLHDAMSHLPGTLVRSPARLVYFTLFALSFALGAGIDRLLAAGNGKIWSASAVAALLVAHGLDLGSHDRCFIRTCQAIDAGQLGQEVLGTIGDGRAAIDVRLLLKINRAVDDVGYFDSIALAKPYRALIDLGDKPAGWNTQYIDGADLNVRALEVCAVKILATMRQVPGQPPPKPGQTQIEPVHFPTAANRVRFFPLSSTVVADLPEIHTRLRDRGYDLLDTLLIPTGSPAPPADAKPISLPATTTYTRESEDKMTISVTAPQSGYLRIDEAWDIGWHATVDGTPTPLFAGDDVFLTLPLSPGYHKVELEFSTPGAFAGLVISLLCLGALIWVTRAPKSAALPSR